MIPRIGIAALLTLIVFYLALSASHAQFVSGGLFNNGQATTSPTPPPPSYAGPADVPGVGAPTVWWSADSCVSTAFSGTIADLVDTATGTIGTRLQCASGGVVSALVSGSACTFVSGNVCSPFLTTCGAGPTYTCSVLKLYDQSTASNCSGPCNLTNPLANAPALIANPDGSTANCMSFVTAAPTVLFSAASSSAINQSYTVIGIYERTAAFTTEGNILNWANLTIAFNGSADSIFANGGATAPVTASDSHLHAVQFVMSDPSFAGTSNAQVDSTPFLGITTGPNGPGAGQIASLGGGLDFLTGYICEMGIWPLAFTTTPTTGEMALMNTNMHTRNNF